MNQQSTGHPTGDGRPESAVERGVAELRRLIRNGDLAPGEHIRQAQLAEHLGVSRVPVREALKVLSTEGIIVYEPNHGYYVAKMDPNEISQLYTMRRLLESELLSSLEWPDSSQLEELNELNNHMKAAAAEGDTHSTIRDNRTFHFRILELSPKRLILREVDRLWSVSDAYRAVYHYSHGSEDIIFEQHDRMLDALRRQEVDALIEVTNQHRSQAQDYVVRLLRGRTSTDLR